MCPIDSRTHSDSPKNDAQGRSLRDRGGPTLSAEDEDRLVAAAREVVRPWRESWLETLHRLGRLLNDALGVPTRRQKYAAGTLQRVAREVQIDGAELSRARWLAHVAASPEDFRERFPEVATVRELREALPRIREAHLGQEAPTEPRQDAAADGSAPKRKTKSKKSKRKTGPKRNPQARECLRLLGQVRRLVKSRRFRLSDGDRESLSGALRTLTDALQKAESNVAPAVQPVSRTEATVASHGTGGVPGAA